mmetsp:Transcript_9197/g.26449  ORF Transcript_9197/g.26449 Transcript_9197/m.26449 type:complete len:273 (-) Transcript_9197:60-878(-)
MEAPPSDNLYIQDMPAELDEAAVKSTFEQYGSVQSVRLFPKEGMPKMSCFVRFASMEEAKWVQENVNGNIPEGLTEPIQVRFADTPESKAARLAAKGWGKGGDSWGAGGGSWGKSAAGKGDAWGAASWNGAQRSSPYGDGKGKGKGKDKGKDKGKGRGSLAADDPFWEAKQAEEGRQVGDGTVYTGIIQGYNTRAGWGFVAVEDVSQLPPDIAAAMEASAAEAKAKGKEAQANVIYFRKPDCAPGFVPQKEQVVAFQIYTDSKGVGAYNISG